MSDSSIRFFVFVDAGENDVGKIREALLENDHIILTHCLLGPTDLICYAQADTIEQINALVLPAIDDLLEAQHHPIKHTETMLALEHFGEDLTREDHNDPNGIGAWILTNIAVRDASIVEKFLSMSDDVLAVYNVVGRYDSIVYAVSPNFESLHETLDTGIRNLRTFAKRGTAHAIQNTDTRIVLNYERGY